MLDRRANVNEIRHDKCLRRIPTNYLPRDLSAYRLERKWATWGARKEKAKARASKCVPTNPTAIIRYVFPAATEDAAVRVAYCETGGTFNIYATNTSSGAAGLFQLMPFHWQGRFNPYDPWANSRYAYRLSSAGYDWSAWVCKP